jgi:integrase
MGRRRSYGTGSKQKRGKGGRRTRLRWYDEHGRRHSKTVDSELADKALLIRLGREAAGEAGTKPDPRLVPTIKALGVEWLAERTNRSADDDRSRWRNHIEPELGHLRPDEVTQAVLRRFVMGKLAKGKLYGRGKKMGKATAEGLNPATVGLCIKELSVFFNHLVVSGEARFNPCSHGHIMPETRRRIRSTHDPKKVPFIRRLEDIRRVYLALPEPVNIAFALGVMAGLRTAEIQALPWAHVDLARGCIDVQVQAPTKNNPRGLLKDNDSRTVLIQDDLFPLLTEWKLQSTGPRVVPSMRPKRRYLDVHTMGKEIRKALDSFGLMVTPWAKPWYQATRHTFASQWMLGGGEIAKLKEQMGHCSITVTERYAHLSPDLFGPKDKHRIRVDLSRTKGTVIEMPKAAVGGSKLGPGSGPADDDE